MLDQMKLCTRCYKIFPEINFFHFKNGKTDWLCKSCRTFDMDCENEEDIKYFCQICDIPFIKEEWYIRLNREREKHGALYSRKAVCGKYLSLMKLKGYCSYTYSDSDNLNFSREFKKRCKKNIQ